MVREETLAIDEMTFLPMLHDIKLRNGAAVRIKTVPDGGGGGTAL